MATINLRDYYPDYYTTDYIIDVPDEVKENMVPLHQEEAVYRRRMRRNNVCSYDDDYMETQILRLPTQPDEALEAAECMRRIEEAIHTLPELQSRRVYAALVLGIKQSEIAASEGVAKNTISESIERGIKNLRKKLKNFY